MRNKKKIITIVIIIFLVLAAIIGGIVYFVKNRTGSVVDVYSMEYMNNAGWAEGDSTLSGTIISDFVQEVYADEDQNVAEVYVQQGDYVEKGDNLLKYDVEEKELDLQLQKLEIESSTLELEDLQNELTKMKNTRASGTIDGVSNVMNASLNLSSLKGNIMATLLSDPSGDTAEEGTTDDDTNTSDVTGDDDVKETTGTENTDDMKETDETKATEEENVPPSDETDKDDAASDDGSKEHKLHTSVNAVSDRETGEGTDGAPYVFLLKGNRTDKMISGSLIIELLKRNATAVFKVYESETAYEDDSENTIASFVLNPVYDEEGFDANLLYSIDGLKEAIQDKNLKSIIAVINDKSYGDGSANDAYIYLLSDGGTVKGSVVHSLVRGEYYAEFQEFESEDSYKKNPHSPSYSISITPGSAIAGIEASREYTLSQLKTALDAAEAASALPNVLKSEITDKEDDAYSGSGTMDDPYVYRLISNGRIRGSVINALMQSNEFAVIYEYDSEEDGRKENVANSFRIRPNVIFKESIASFGWYTLADLDDATVTADKIQIRPDRKTVKAGKTYKFVAKLTGKNSDVLTVSWKLKRNKSSKTTLVNGRLTVGTDETADTLRIVASAGGKRAVLTVKVKQDDTDSGRSSGRSSSGSSSGSSSSGSSSSGSSSGGDSDYSSYTASELEEAIREKEEEIAEAKQNLNEAKIEYEEARQEVEAATVKATVEGEVTLAYTKEAMPDDGSPAIIVRGEDGMYVRANVSEMSLDTVKVGGTISCTSSETYEQYEAEIIEISPYPSTNSGSDYSYAGTSNPNSSYYPIVAYIADAEGLTTGESVEVSYSSQSMGTLSDEAIYLQKAYVRSDDGGSYVYKEGNDGCLTKQYVKTGETLYGQYVEIVSGLTMDDNIAFPYGSDVKEGAKVELSENMDNIIY